MWGDVLHYVLLVTTWSSFNVPSTSMLPTLQPGDYMLVNKWVMGARIYDLREAAGRRQFPVYRIPGFSQLERNDIMGWTVKEFGPLHVPAKGQEVRIDSTGWKLYRSMIAWEQKKRVSRTGNDVYLNDSLIRWYRFRENYYFAGGDNMQPSYDSRYWGLVPEPFIAGKAVRIWKSVNPYTGRMRWNRFWKEIK